LLVFKQMLKKDSSDFFPLKNTAEMSHVKKNTISTIKYLTIYGFLFKVTDILEKLAHDFVVALESTSCKYMQLIIFAFFLILQQTYTVRL